MWQKQGNKAQKGNYKITASKINAKNHGKEFVRNYTSVQRRLHGYKLEG